MVEVVLNVLLVLSSLLLVVLILLHRGKGGGLSSMFGGAVSSSLAGSSVVEKNLNRLTVFCGARNLRGCSAAQALDCAHGRRGWSANRDQGSARGWWQRDPGQPGRRRSDG
jgi:preprotein translocase subunit SecG